MAKKMYAGQGAAARKVRKAYLGQSGARKVKRGYIGVGGVAQKFFGGADLVYFGGSDTGMIEDTGIIYPMRDPSTTVLNRNVLFRTTDILLRYDMNFVKTKIAAKSLSYRGSAENNEDHALFFGENVAEAFDKSFVCTEIYGTKIRECAAAKTDRFILNAGGYLGGTSSSSEVYCYDANLSSKIKYLSLRRYVLAGASVGGHALFAGGNSTGYSSGGSAVVDAFDDDLVRQTIEGLKVGRYGLEGGTIPGRYAIFSGGEYPYNDAVDAYDCDLVHQIATPLSEKKRGHRMTAIDSGVVVTGGVLGGSGGNPVQESYSAVDVYDEDLVKTSPFTMKYKRYSHGAEILGNVVFIAGGYTLPPNQTSVELFKT